MPMTHSYASWSQEIVELTGKRVIAGDTLVARSINSISEAVKHCCKHSHFTTTLFKRHGLLFVESSQSNKNYLGISLHCGDQITVGLKAIMSEQKLMQNN